MLRNALAGTAAAVLSLVPATMSAQLAEFMGHHVMETLPYEIPGTGRIGGVTVDWYGYIYVANQDEGIWKIHPSGEVEHFVKGLYGSASGAMLPNGHLLHAEYNGDRIVRVERNGTVHPFVTAGLEGPVGIAIVGDAVFTVNAKSNWVAKISMDGEVTEFLRDDRLRIPNGITADPDGNLYVVSLGNTTILKITQQGEVSELATLPGTANGHVALAGGALYVTQIWENVVLRVEMDGSYQVVAGDGTLRLRDGTPQESRTPFPNGITASSRGDVLYFNTLEGDMVPGHEGIIRVHKLHVPNPNRAFETAWTEGGMDSLRAKFDAAKSLREAQSPEFVQNLYQVVRHLLNRGHREAGLALVEWTAEIDENEMRRSTQVGGAHLIHGDRNTAIKNFTRAVELAPSNEVLQRLLESARTYRRNQT